MKLHCPHCGERPENEFTYGGDATVTRPVEFTEESRGDWMNYVYYRDNPRGMHTEFWYHSSGCRAWLKVQRDTMTHEIHSVESMEQQQTIKGAAP